MAHSFVSLAEARRICKNAAVHHLWLDERQCVLEALTAFKRAGADAILTYFAVSAATWLKHNK